MPFSRGRKPVTSKISKLQSSKSKASENQDEATRVKRSSTPPKGAAKKRTAFLDITNVNGLSFALISFRDICVPYILHGRPNHCLSITSEEQEKELQKREPLADEPRADPLLKDPLPVNLQPPEIPPEFDIDSEHAGDCIFSAGYAKEIFDNIRSREDTFILHDYMATQPFLNENMRAILVDWLVEVQENYELNHETLYLAVKLMDHYLSRMGTNKESLQLVGCAAMLIASKFEERIPPSIDDFLYICDDAYKRSQLITMEASILNVLNFDINIPVPYHFLRRYAKCVGANMETLTLARYFCELSLQDMVFLPVRGSLLASACLLIALVTKDLGGWTPILQFHSSYAVGDLAPVVRKLHHMLSKPSHSKLEAIKSKYSHSVFFEVAKTPNVDLEKLEQFL
uniref:G2/mitotic-specific cyclin-B3 n=1 Tax=Denticeps clupeoides TaxID=299321 RepID=A0AAY4CJI0_9TELE